MVAQSSQDLGERLLKKVGASIGDRVRVIKGDFIVEGILLPRPILAKPGYIQLKLDNGYNIGVKVTEDTQIVKVKSVRAELTGGLVSPEVPKPALGLPRVHIISTGGTIASRVDYRTGAVYPALTSQDLYKAVPEITSIAQIETEVLYSIFSEDMKPHHWAGMAEKVVEKIREGSMGVVIAHGTDTMAYSAAALSFALRNLPVPVVLVGSQRSSDRPSSDATLNLISAVLVAARAPFAEVVIVMHGESSDTYCLAHRGTKVRKMHTSRRDAFKSINDVPLAKIEGMKITILNKRFNPRRGDREVILENKFDEKVSLVKIYPGMSGDIIDYMVDKKYHGIVLEGTGLGHVPHSIFPSIRRAIEEEIPVVVTSQCLYGRINMNVYSTGRELLAMGVIPGEDMLPEVALVKLMWVLAKTRNLSEVKSLMLTNIAGEINPRTLLSHYY